jgi:hypothetical protein
MNTVKLQVPIDKDIRDEWEHYAHRHGFDSLQAYIRFMAKADVDGRKVSLHLDDWGQPSDAAAARLNEAAEDAKKGRNISGPFETVEDFMKDLQ